MYLYSENYDSIRCFLAFLLKYYHVFSDKGYYKTLKKNLIDLV